MHKVSQILKSGKFLKHSSFDEIQLHRNLGCCLFFFGKCITYILLGKVNYLKHTLLSLLQINADFRCSSQQKYGLVLIFYHSL